jgi:1-acyl-sn-glycerol-3-phosphate acyltransferase
MLGFSFFKKNLLYFFLKHPLLRKIGVRNNRLPYDYLPRIWAKWAMLIFGIQARLEGWENARPFCDSGTSTIGMFEHSSFFDFIVVMGSCDILFKWVSKKSLYKIPMLGLMAYMSGMIPIDRTNLESAKRSLDHATYVAQHYGRAIAIAPEGTRSANGQLAEFKKGAFHLALNCKVDATPLVLFGAYTLWPPNTLSPSPGVVTLRFLPPVNTNHFLPDRYNAMLKQVRTDMLNAMANPPPHEMAPPTGTAFAILSHTTVAATYALTAAVGWGIWKLFHLH